MEQSCGPGPREVLGRAPPAGEGALAVSEPIDDASIGWDSVPPQSLVRIDRADVEIRPFRR